MTGRGWKIVATALLVVLIPGATALAQSTTSGNIRGVVTDPQGEVLPGVTVTAQSDALVAGELLTVTNASGIYRFPSLPPGMYTFEAVLDGFRSVRREGVRIQLGGSLELDLQLGSPEIEEEIIVVSGAVAISTVSNSVGTNFDTEFVEQQPLLRTDPVDLMNFAPGVTDDQAYGAPSTYQNAFYLDGVDVSDPGLGSQWVLPSMDWVKEVQVVGLGADAEYAGFTGAAINLITKSGGNTFQGDLKAFYSGGDLNSDNAPAGAEGVNTISSDWDVSLSLGGKFIADRLWYFFSANERARSLDPFYSAGAPVDDRNDTTREWSRYLGKLTYQVTDNQRLLFLADYDGVDEDYRGVGDLTLASGSQIQDSPSWSYNASWESLVNERNFFSAKLTGFHGVDDRLPQFGDLPNRYDAETGFDWQNTIYRLDQDKDRMTVDFSWSLFADGLFTREDSHNFKFGALLETSDHDEVWTRTGGFSYYDDSWYCDSVDAYFANPDCALFSSDRGGEIDLHAEMEGLHLFAQDSWKVGRASFNYGVRYTQYQGGFQGGASDVYDVDMLAPRLGMVYDLFGNGSTAVKAHFGRYYEGMAAVFYDREISGNVFSDTEYWDYNFDTGQFDLFFGSRKEGGALIDPAVGHPYVDQWVLTLERQLTDTVILGLDVVHRENEDVVAMVTSNVGDYDAQTAPDNPFGGGEVPFFDLLEEPEFLITNPAAATREYDALMLRLNRRYRSGWRVNASLVWTDLEGNADYGLAGYVDEFEDLNGLTNAQGKLPFQSEWEFKATGAVDLPWEMMLSGYYRFRSGTYWTPYARFEGLYQNDRRNVFLTPRGSEQYDDRSVLDLHLEKSIEFADTRLTLMVDAFNVLDSDTVTRVVERWGRYLYQWDAHPGESEWVDSSSFRDPLSIESPRQVRLGARLTF